MKTRLVLCLATLGLAIASAKSYSIDLYGPTMAGGTQLDAGKYNVEVLDKKVVISKGKVRVESAVTVSNADSKFDSTKVVVALEGDKRRIQEIRLGGTTTKLVLAQ